MLVIECPWCGPRNSSEFSFSGTKKPRPTGPPTPAQWRRYLYEQDNLAGLTRERWFHVDGCRRFLDIERHNVTNQINQIKIVGGR